MKNEKIKFRDRVKDISAGLGDSLKAVSYTHLTLPTNREV